MDKEQKAAIGLRIRGCRENLGYSRDQLAEKTSLAVSFISAVELGKISFGAESLIKLCTALNVSADYILFGSKEQTDLSVITAMLSGLDPQYLPLLQDLLSAYVKTITLSQPVPLTNAQPRP